MPIPEITEDIIHRFASASSISKGYYYYDSGAVKDVKIEKGAYIARVQGSELYTVKISEKNAKIDAECTCPYDWGGVCKHIVATMIAIGQERKIKEHKSEVKTIRSLLDKVESDRLKEFLLQVLIDDPDLLKDFKIFARGREETKNTSEKYKKEVLACLEELKDIEYYYDHYRDSYEHPVSEIIENFTETAQKYTAQENYKEAIKIYQGICDACIEALKNERLVDFYDDIHFHAIQSFGEMAKNIQKLCISLKNKEPYLDYLLQAYDEFEDKDAFKDVLHKLVTTPEEADYVLNKEGVDLIPPIKLNLLIVKGEPEEVFLFGEKYYKEYPEMAIPLSEFYIKQKMKDNAIALAEKAIGIIQGKRKDFYYSFSSDSIEKLRTFLDKYYSLDADYPKIIENLIMLLMLNGDIAYYKKLRKIIKTEGEKTVLIERLEKLLAGDYDLLFKIYSIEDDYEKMLKLAAKCIESDVFHLIVKRIRNKYPDECFELYKKKINKFTEVVKNRDAYRQTANWLKLMKEIPGRLDRFQRYIKHLREKYRRRPAFIEEVKDI